MTTERKRKVIIDVLFIAVMLVVVYFVMKYVAVWTLPFIIGLLVAIVLQKPVGFLTERTKLSRTFWSIVLVVSVLVAIFTLIGVVIWRLVEEADGFTDWLTGLIPDIRQTFTDMSSWFTSFSNKLPDGVGAAIQDAPAAVLEGIVNGLAGVVTGLAEGIITQGPGILISVIFSVVASCYMTKDYRKIVNFIINQLSDRKAEIVINTKKLFVTNILKMLRGYIIIMFITFLELFLGFTVLGVNYAVVLAIIVAILDILPVIGTGLVLLPWAVVSVCMGNLVQGLGLFVLYIVILIIRNIIEPRIIGQQVGLPPIVTLIAMYVGLRTFGVLGMMLLPVATIILVKLQEGGIIRIWKGIDTYTENATKKAKKKAKKKKVQDTAETQ
ncbi:MAG: sporulation integral membrane protein YtvI [Ruminococcus sp.]|nr:sporulation integral membrane protein YtvI [Ruminococcus sp.]